MQNFQMDVGAISEQVLVSSDVPVIETATTSVGTVISQRTVQEIPLDGRHFVDLGLLIPGSVTPPQNGFLTAPLRGQFGFNIGGPVNLPRFGDGGPIFSYTGKNKTFFFFSYEGLRQRQGLTLTSNVLTDAQRASVTNPTVRQLLPLIPLATSVDVVVGVPVARFAGSGTAAKQCRPWFQ